MMMLRDFVKNQTKCIQMVAKEIQIIECLFVYIFLNERCTAFSFYYKRKHYFYKELSCLKTMYYVKSVQVYYKHAVYLTQMNPFKANFIMQ